MINVCCPFLKLITISDVIAIKVLDIKEADTFVSLGAATTLFLNKYTVIVEKAQCLHEIIKRYMYNIPQLYL
jgi:hypothetical protein